MPSKSVITLTATVTGANSTSITMGTISFYDGLNTFFIPLTGTGSPQPHVVGQAQVQSNGTAVFATILPSATHTLFAVYMPTPQGLGSTSGSVTLMVNGGGHEKLTVNASVGGQKGAYTLQNILKYQGVSAPTGTLNILDNTTSSTLASSTHISDQGSAHAGMGLTQGSVPAVTNGTAQFGVADLDGDGIPDLIVPNGATLSAFHGVGDGTFTNRVNYSIPSGSSAFIDTGDVNHDGYPDVVVADTSNNAVDVFLNTGSGGLLAATVYPVTNPGRIVLANFGSGYLDIATLQQLQTIGGPTGVNVLTNNGSGGYGAPALLDVSGFYYHMATNDFAVADFNGDGYLDLGISCDWAISGVVVTYYGSASGLSAASVSGNPVLIETAVAGDYNGDGVTDFGYASNPGFIYAHGNIQTNTTPFGLAGADVDGNGWVDTIYTGGSGNFYVAYGEGFQTGFYPNPTVTTVGPFTSPASGPITTASLQGDGLSDVIFGGGAGAEWLSFLDVSPVYPAGSTAEQPIRLLSTTSLAPHQVTVQYVPASGGSYGSATSNTVQLTPLGDVIPALTLSPASISYTSGPTSTLLTASLQALSTTYPTGSVTFYDAYTQNSNSNANTIGTATLSNGVASIAFARPISATHTITAVYGGDSNYISETSAPSTLVVTAETPTLTLSSSPSTSIVGGMVTLTGSLTTTNTNVAGVVLQFDIAGSNTTSCVITSSGLSGSCSVALAVPANGLLQAHLSNVLDSSGHPNLASGTATAGVTGTQVAGNVGIQSSTNPSYQGQSVSLTLIAPVMNGVYANGTASVYDNGSLLQTVNFAGATTATITTAAFTVGTHTLTTHYNGDTNGRTLPNGNVTTVASFIAATGTSQVSQVVVTATLSLPLTISSSTVSQGTQQTLSVFVNNSSVAVTGALVTFYDADSNPRLLGAEPVNSSGIATWTQLYSAGAHSFYVVVTLPGAGLTTHESSRVSGTVTPSATAALGLNLAVTGQPGSYTSTVTANYMSTYPLSPVSLLNVSNSNSSLGTINFNPPVFTLPTSSTFLPAGIGALSSAAGDLNHDGKTDLVVGNYWDETVSIYLGNGDGTFQSATVLSVGLNSPDKIILGDFDGDGNLDFAIICDYQQSGTLWFGDGTGSFSQTSTTGIFSGLNVPIDTTDELAVDLDKDGQLDLVAVGFGFNVNLSSRNFNNVGASINGSPVWVATADFDNDGNPDLITANLGGGTATTNSISVLLGDGTGNLSASVNLDIPGTPGGITTGDFDEDGNADIAVALYDTQQIALFRGKGDGTFYAYTLIAAGGTVGAQGIQAVDYDGDGSLDLVLADTAIVLGNADGAYAPGVNFGRGNQVVTTSSGQMLYLRGDGLGNFDSALPISVGANTTPVDFALADFNGDGIADLAVPQTAGFDDLNNTTTTSTIGILLGSNTATAVLANSSAVNTAGPVQIKARHVQGSPDAFPTTNSNTVQLQSQTTAAITSSSNPSPLGSSLTITAAVSTVASVVPTGSVQFFDGATSLGTGTLSSGVATITTSALAIGGHTITALYGGDAHFVVASATALSQTVSPAGVTATLTSSTNPAHYGASLTFTASVSSSSATGTVIFKNGSTVLGSAQLSSGSATYTTALLPIGTSMLSATYLGDASNGAATSPAVAQVVMASNAATTTLSVTPSSGAYGAAVTMTATLGTNAATGMVTFSNGGTPLGTAAVINGVATFNATSLNVGTYSITAAYSGDAYYSASTSGTASLTITQATLTLSPAVAIPPIAPYATNVTLTQAMPPGATGTVTFTSGGNTLGTATIANGVATLVTAALPVGTNPIAASYSGNANLAPASSTGGTVTIVRATPVLAAPSASSMTAAFGASVTLTQTVPSGVTGTVTFSAGGTVLGTGTIASGVATLTTTALPAGVSSITTTTSANANYTSAISPALSITITPPTTTMTLSASPVSGAYGTSVIITATLTASAGSAPMTGTVSFAANGSSLGTGSITSAVATLTTAALPAGSNTVTATFAANANYGGSTATASVTITRATPTLSAPAFSPANPGFGTAVTLTQAVPTGLTGTISFSAGGVTLGSATIANGVATLITTALPVGANSVAASYGGGANYTAATSAAVSIAVTQASPSLSAPTVSPVSPAYGQSVSLTQLVPSGLTGSLSFYSNGVSLGSASITAGVATLTTTALQGGANVVTTQYAGGGNYTSGTSSPLSVTVSPATVVLAAPAASPASASYGASVTLTQTVPTTVTGSITFSSGSVLLGTSSIVGGVATLVTTSIPAGANSITGAFAGNTNYAAATSAAVSVSITAIPTSMIVSATPANSAYGTPVSLAATVSNTAVPANIPQGTVSFVVNGTSVGTATLANGAATLSYASLPVGSDSVSAFYAAQNNFAAATSAVVTATVTQATLTLSAPVVTPNTASYGSAVTLTQSVPSGVTGTVTFSANGATLGAATIASGAGTLTTSALQGGANSIVASYGGSTNYAAATSSAASITITPVTPTLAAPSVSPTSPSPGQSVTLSQTVPAGATGTVTFSANGATLGTATIANGLATLTTTALAPGANSITAFYGGNNNYTSATSPAVTVGVGSGTLTLAMPTASPATAAYGTAVVMSQAVPIGFTGSLTFLANGVAIGTATAANGVASLTTSTLAAGVYMITTSFAGSSMFAASTSPAATVTITQTTSALPAPVYSPSTAPFGQSVTLTMTLPAGATGTVSFYVNGVLLGTATVTNGAATLSTSALPAGSDTIVASYSGDANYAAVNSAPATIAITPASDASFSMVANPAALTLHPGQTESSIITFTPTGGFVGTAALACAGLPPGITCLFTANGQSVTSVSFAGDDKVQQATIQVTVSPTFFAKIAMLGSQMTMIPAAGLLFACLGVPGRTRRKRGALLSAAAILVMFGAIAGTAGCGGGGFGSKANPAGTVVKTVQVTATATATATPGSSANPAPPLNLTITVVP